MVSGGSLDGRTDGGTDLQRDEEDKEKVQDHLPGDETVLEPFVPRAQLQRLPDRQLAPPHPADALVVGVADGGGRQGVARRDDSDGPEAPDSRSGGRSRPYVHAVPGLDWRLWGMEAVSAPSLWIEGVRTKRRVCACDVDLIAELAQKNGSIGREFFLCAAPARRPPSIDRTPPTRSHP